MLKRFGIVLLLLYASAGIGVNMSCALNAQDCTFALVYDIPFLLFIVYGLTSFVLFGEKK
jgi:hypothetical protein